MCAVQEKLKGRNGTKAAWYIYVTGDTINACIVTYPTSIRHQLSYLPTKKRTKKDLLQRSMIMKKSIYIEDVESSAKKLCMRSNGSRGDADSVIYNASGEWIWSHLIPMSSSSLFPIITTFLAYIEKNHFTYSREN